MERFTNKNDHNFNKRTPDLVEDAKKWAEKVLLDPIILDVYIKKGTESGCSAFEAACNDYCTSPIILGIFFHKLPYPRIVVRVVDDHQVLNVYCLAEYDVLEYKFEGMAQYIVKTGYWELPIDPTDAPYLRVSVLAEDVPGNNNFLCETISPRDF